MEEPNKYFENAFLVDCHEFIINIDYPINIAHPVVYDISLESHEKILLRYTTSNYRKQ